MPVEVRPHACVALALSIAKVRLPVTSVGARRLTVSPVPSWPRPFQPQQYAVPDAVSPHVIAPPALKVANFRPPATAMGVKCVVVSPVPSSPLSLAPQQYTAPPDVSAQLWNPPPLSDASATAPATATGDEANGSVVPPASCPDVLSPQQYAAWVAARPQVWKFPVASAVNVTVNGGGGGGGGGSVTPFPPFPPHAASTQRTGRTSRPGSAARARSGTRLVRRLAKRTPVLSTAARIGAERCGATCGSSPPSPNSCRSTVRVCVPSPLGFGAMWRRASDVSKAPHGHLALRGASWAV